MNFSLDIPYNIFSVGITRYPDGGNTVQYTGLDAFDYYFGFVIHAYEALTAWFSDYSWQVQFAFMLIIACIGVMIYVAIQFMRQIRSAKVYNDTMNDAKEKLHDAFYEILINFDEPPISEVEEKVGMTIDEIRKYPPQILATLLLDLRLELSEVTSLPNINFLGTITGVSEFYEYNLANKIDILTTLQNIVTMTLKVSEGLLAIYINHHNDNIRHMARMGFIVCTETEPYQYLQEDLQEEQALWRPMMLHRLFGWLRDTERQMPQFLVLASVTKMESTAAFLIEEVAYWGSDKEKASLKDFFLSPMLKCRESALKAVAFLGDDKQEEAIVESYDQQPENLRRECLKAVSAINSGKNTDFFIKVFHDTSSKETRECALTCLYHYGREGRRRFEMMREEIGSDKQGINLLNQIDAMEILQQMRTF